jgi:hypothetical protein
MGGVQGGLPLQLLELFSLLLFGGMIIGRRKLKEHSGKNLPQYKFVHYKSHKDCYGLNLGLCSKMQGFKHLNKDMANQRVNVCTCPTSG